MFKPNLDLGKVIVENQNKYESKDSSQRKTYKWFSPDKVGLHRIRVLPPYSQRGDFGKDVFQFFKLPTLDPSKTANHFCVEKMFPEKGVECPIMKVIREIDYLSERGKKFAFDAWKANPVHRYYMNVLVRSSTNFPEVDPKVIHIGNFPPTMKAWIWSKLMDPDFGDITDPLNGRDLKITRNEVNKKTTYDRDVVPTTSPIITNTDEIEEFLKDLPDLDAVFAYPSAQVFEKIKESAELYRNRLLENFNLVGKTFASAPMPAPSIPVAPQAPPSVQVSEQSEPTSVPTTPALELPVVQSSPQPTAPVVTSTVDPPTVAPVKSSLPKDAPECFGNKDIFNPKEMICQICVYEIQCAEKIKKG